jgi:acetolactate synthase-1/2/3 large subunit
MTERRPITYADHVTDLLVELGYTHCFLLPGGAIMHLVNAARSRMTCIPVVHEASAVIGAEYFNQITGAGRAYALVTAGPGVTNALTGMAGAYLESRNVLVLAGQVKSADLARGTVRQRGIQELDGLAMASAVSVASQRIEVPEPDDVIRHLVLKGLTDRQGPVYLEFCLDAQGAPVQTATGNGGHVDTHAQVSTQYLDAAPEAIRAVSAALSVASRPLILIGGGVDHSVARETADGLASLGVPLMTTWNGFDRVSDEHPCFAGRPNTWGQRSANVLLAQADCIVALGTRLGIQQTGFNWQQWGPPESHGVVIHVDIDEGELRKGHPRVDASYLADANAVLRGLASLPNERSVGRQIDDSEGGSAADDISAWWRHIENVRKDIPLLDPENVTRDGFISPYALVDQLSDLLAPNDILIPASSGSGQFVPMETFRLQRGQRVVTNKGLASMGYGLPGAIGAAAAGEGQRIILVEGDGSFSQSIQELGTLALHDWPVKIFLLDNDGYASIRTTQRNYFDGAYLGCDSRTGLGLPDWRALAGAFGIPSIAVGPQGLEEADVLELLNAPGPAIFVVRIDPEQTYFPKVNSRIAADGSMQSSPIHFMSPQLPASVADVVFSFLPQELQ